MTVGKRILSGFGLLLLLTLALGFYALHQLGEIRDVAFALAERDVPILELLRAIEFQQSEMRVKNERVVGQHLLQRAGLIRHDPAPVREEWRRSSQKADEFLSRLQTTARDYEQNALTEARRQKWRQIAEAAEEGQKSLERIQTEVETEFQLMEQGALPEMVARIPRLDTLREDFDNRVSVLAGLIEEVARLGQERAAEVQGQALRSTTAALLLVVLVGLAGSLLIQRSITRPLRDFRRFAEEVGLGDLRGEIISVRRDELGTLATSLNSMVGGLKNVAGQTRAASQNLNSAVAEMLASSKQLVASTEEQVASVQETTATVEEISRSTEQVSERARELASMAETASSGGSSGIAAVEEMNRSMEAIREQAEAVAENIVTLSERAQAVGQIIATVNDIAERSKLLALNASIEAAAAGDQGRSFSVVASEMRNLAEQAKDATGQVRGILEEIRKGINSSVMLTEETVKRVGSGKRQSEVAVGTIRHMAGSIDASMLAFQQIIASVNQQGIGFEQVARALENIHTAARQNAATTRQFEGSASDLSALSQQLQKAVERYKL